MDLKMILRKSRYKRRITVAILAVLLLAVFGRPAVSQESPRPLVKAYFLGYEGDDIIFRITNDHEAKINIKGLAFNHQVLYRPVDKKASVPIKDNENPFKDIYFRSAGDYIWSENHMQRFELAYFVEGLQERQYAKIYKIWEGGEEEKGLDSAVKP